jgi:hypothetical protein
MVIPTTMRLQPSAPEEERRAVWLQTDVRALDVAARIRVVQYVGCYRFGEAHRAFWAFFVNRACLEQNR